MNRVLGMILTLVFSLTIVFASADLNVTKNVSSNDLNQGDTITITFDLDSNATNIIRNNLGVVLAIDGSFSMWDETKKNDAQNSAIYFIEQLDQNYDQIGLVFFANTKFDPFLLTNNFENIKSEINAWKFWGVFTNVYTGLKESNNLFEDNNYKKIIILLSDGKHNEIIDTGKSHNDVIEKANEIKNSGIIIYTIAIGDDADTNFMKNIASENKAYSAKDTEDLQSIFEDIKEDIDQLTAENIIIKDVLPTGVEYISGPSNCDYNLENRTVNCIVGALNNGESNRVSFDILVKDYNLNYVNEATKINYSTNETNYEIDFNIEQQPSVKVNNKAPDVNDLYIKMYSDIDVEILIDGLQNAFDYDPIYIDGFSNVSYGTLNNNYNWFTYKPNPGFIGDDNFNIIVSDGNLTTSAMIYINISLKNNPPILKDINNYSVTQNKTLEFNINATDFDSNVLRFKIDENYNWLELIDNNSNSAKIILKPTTNTIPGNYNLNIFVYDDYNAFDTKVSTITVIKKTVTPPTGGGGGGSSGGSSGSNIIGECIPEVRYSDWSECINGKQTRTYEIINSCENQTIDLLEKPCFIFEEREKIVNEIITDNNNIDLNTNQLTTPTGLFTLGNGLIPGIITMMLLLLGYAGYKIYSLKRKALL